MLQLSKRIKIAIAAVFCFLILFLLIGGTLVWAQSYDGRMGPRTWIGPLDVSGLDPEQAVRALRESADELYASGVTVTLDGREATVPLSTLVGSDSVDIVSFDVERSVRMAFDLSHRDNAMVDAAVLLDERLFNANRVGVIVSVNGDGLHEAVRAAFPGREMPARDAAFVFEEEAGAWTATVADGWAGDEFDFEPFLTELLARLSEFDETPVRLEITHREPEITREQAIAVVDDALLSLARAPLTLASDDGRTWTVAPADLAIMLVPENEMAPGIGISETALDAFLGPIATEIEVDAQNARFLVENGRVSEFVGSRDGLTIHREELRTRLAAAARGDAEGAVHIPTLVTEPEISTEEVNDLGIAGILGTGVSSFRGSPANRVKNIQNGVRLLNGLLIAPGETFSLLHALRPFETANGYLPELVIKGDKIEPEIGGGLCQIGTTTFRAAMNSGLKIAKRSNHSLVVSYYNDPGNGNPGTDATIYDPAPDFQFVNDTGHHVLFEALMDEETQGLRFTFWGTSDGRKASYEPPTVLRWIGVGPTVNTETLALAPGQKKCQGAHVGADTTFTYSIVRPDGTLEETEFASHYRPLPEICLVGVEELSTPEDLQPPADSVSSSQASEAPVDSDDAPRTDTETNTE